MGRWSLDRTIQVAGGPDGRLAGETVFAPVPGGLEQRERGTLRLGDGPQMTAERRYLWGPGPEVRFADGRPFHTIGLGRRPDARHDCGPDVYLVRYDFALLEAGEWIADWDVRGPRKDYAMRSVHRRA